jgi:hypothetical protein
VSRIVSKVRAEYLLPFACVAAAICVGASEFMTTFEFDLGTSGEPQQTIAASDRHSYALLLIAIFALFALVVALISGSRPAAAAVAVAGGLALLFFLLVDLPDVGQQGTVDDPSRVFTSSEAEPGEGFWLEMVGTVALAVSGGALATLRSEQLRMLLWGSPEAPTAMAERAEHARRIAREQDEAGTRPVARTKLGSDQRAATGASRRTRRRRGADG